MFQLLSIPFSISLSFATHTKIKHNLVCWSPPLARLNVHPPTPLLHHWDANFPWKWFFPGRLHFHSSPFQKSWLSKWCNVSTNCATREEGETSSQVKIYCLWGGVYLFNCKHNIKATQGLLMQHKKKIKPQLERSFLCFLLYYLLLRNADYSNQ